MKLEEIKNRTKEATDYLVQSLEAGHSEVLTQYLGAMAKFHTYSFGNIMLIARQKPTATNVAGVRTWNSLGRFVRRGEKGILILAPMVGRKGKTVEETTGENREEKNPQARLYGFRAVYVFDISQTEGKDLPALTEVQGDVSGYRERLVKFVEAQSIELRYSDQIGPVKGLSHGGKITLLLGMQPAEEFSTLVHEIGHEMLHRGERRTLTTKSVRETEAEAVAFVVCQAIRDDIAQHLVTSVLDIVSSQTLYTQMSHFAFTITRAMRRNAFRWAIRESDFAVSASMEENTLNEVSTDPSSSFEAKILLGAFLSRCLSTGLITPSEHKLLLLFKIQGVSSEVLAARQQLSDVAFRHRMQRVVEKLRRAARGPSAATRPPDTAVA